MEPSSPGGQTLSIVVVNWNAREHLLRFLGSLEAYPPAVEWDLVVVDNNSTDGSVTAVEREVSWARLLVNRTNEGLSRANNAGLAGTNGQFVLLCNADILVRAGTLDALLDLAARRPRAAFVIPRLVNPDGTLQTAAGDLPTLGEAMFGHRAGRGRGTGFWWHGWDHDEELAVGHGAEACYLVRRAAVDEIGLQDEGFPLDWEGVDCAHAATASVTPRWNERSSAPM